VGNAPCSALSSCRQAHLARLGEPSQKIVQPLLTLLILKVAIFTDQPSNSCRHDRYPALVVLVGLLAAFDWGLATACFFTAQKAFVLCIC
jgi:hypothetical protein